MPPIFKVKCIRLECMKIARLNISILSYKKKSFPYTYEAYIQYKKNGDLFGGVKKNAFYSKIHTNIELQVHLKVLKRSEICHHTNVRWCVVYIKFSYKFH